MNAKQIEQATRELWAELETWHEVYNLARDAGMPPSFALRLADDCYPCAVTE
jgi:hypothetical protein